MHVTSRRAAIRQFLTARGSCSVAALASAVGASAETIRRDVRAMEGQGLLERVHGGVTLPELTREPEFRMRLHRNAAAKQMIARLAAAEIESGDSLMTDTGSTTAYVARALADHSDLLLVTNGVEIARTVATGNRSNHAYVAGGELRGDDAATFGAEAIGFVERFRVRHAVISIGAIHPEHGLMDYHLAEAEFCRAVMARAAHVIVVADHSKFQSQAPVKVCDLECVHTIVTDRPPPPAFRRHFENGALRLVVPAQADRQA